MRAPTFLPVPFALALALAACQPQPAALSEEDVAAIRAVSETFEQAWVAGDHDALAALFSEDAILMPPNGPAVVGRSAIRTWLESGPPLQDGSLTIEEIEGAGDLAYVRGTYSMTVLDESGAPVTDIGKYLEIRQRQPDGSWPLVRDMFNSDMPLPE